MKTISSFNFNMYTEIVFGKDAELGLAELIRKHGGTKVMLIYGSGSIKRSGLHDRIVSMLNDNGLPFVEFGGVKANPIRSFVDKGIQRANEEGVDFFLGVGGGSAIDTAKTIALAVANDGEYWPYFNGTEPPKMAPVGVINTIAAAGSETSRSMVVVDDIDTGLKKGLLWDPCRPVFAILNPELTFSVPSHQTAAGGADIFSHTFMRFFNNDACYLGDEYCFATLRTTRKYTPIAVFEPDNYEARAELMMAAAFSHNDLTGIGKNIGHGGGEHALEHQLSGHYDTAHGAGLAVMMPALLRYVLRHGTAEQIDRIANFAVRVFGSDTEMGHSPLVALDGIERFEVWLNSIGLPTTLTGLGVPEGDVDAAIERCIQDTGGMIGGYIDIDKNGIAEIFKYFCAC
ncbi:MAG: iron-containing alcohol dehydrogenase [Clostridiales bacterium]|nr:iron-containing alcohol dehydrogenase [Clostridiales bacterium]